MIRYLESSANISADGLYRYWLLRRLGMGERTVLFVGLNPSTADGTQDDPTIRRCVGYAVCWGFDLVLMGNLCAYRSTDPKALLTIEDPIGPENHAALKWMARKADIIVAAWGASRLSCTAATLGSWIMSFDHTRCFGFTRNGSPKHPLYLPRDARLRKILEDS